MLDADLAKMYQVETKVLNQAVKRNIDRFPPEFMFQLTQAEYDHLKSQFVTSSDEDANLMSQFATSSWGGRRKLPFAFTEHGVIMPIFPYSHIPLFPYPGGQLRKRPPRT